ncbi:MAG: ATP cone domain-containing protein, partial [Niameybacter sp.]
IVCEIENQIYASERKEISSSEIGEIAMRYLKQIDEVSYIRFASVYKKFKDIDEFIVELENIKKTKS